jgi:hypothetical protein
MLKFEIQAMKKITSNKEKLSKGERLQWKPLKASSVSLPIDRGAITGRHVPEREIKERQLLGGSKNSLLVP